MRYILTQHYTVEHQELFDLTNPINKAYAAEKGLEYISNNVKRCPDRNAWWEKIAWLIELLNTVDENSLIIYEDCDSINLNGDIKAALHDNLEYGMVQMRHGFGCAESAPWYNAGVIMMINTATVKNFFKRVWDRNDSTDEQSMNKELKSLNYTIGNSKPICSLETTWNCWDNNLHLTSDINIKSWHGISYDQKLVDIKKYLNK